MESNWTYWCLVVSLVIMFGQAVFWFTKYCRLRRTYYHYINTINNAECLNQTLCSRTRRYNDDGSFTGAKTTLISDMAIKQAIKMRGDYEKRNISSDAGGER